MNSEVIKKEGNKITIKVTISSSKFQEAVNKAYNKMKTKFNIPGFRKGKVPRMVIEQRYGAEIFYEEAINTSFPEAYEEALEEHDIEPLDQPEIDIEEIKKGEDVVFTAIVEVMPEFTVENYKGIEVQKKEYNVQEEDVQKQLDTMVEKNARIISVEDRPVQDGDLVVLDYRGSVDGEYFEGGTAEKQDLTIGSGQFIPGFEEQLIGINKGEEKNINVIFPEKYHAEHLAGKEAVFEVKIQEIKEKEVPLVDDEFAKDVSEFDTLGELKADIKHKMEEYLKHQKNQEFKNLVVDKIAETVEIEVPKVLLERELDSMLKEFDYNLRYQGINLKSYYEMTGISEEHARNQMKEEAIKQVKVKMVIEQISKQEGIEASQGEAEQELEKIAKQYNKKTDEIKEQLEEKLKDNAMDSIKKTIVIRKTIDMLVENAKQI